ncbi:MAG: nucleotidyl transferase AbiEii/AbiGii toxin family protein [Candidatus Woesearchaeota archaeon]
MISKQELAEIKKKRKTNLYYVEKEYFQYIFLNAISRYSDRFVFKGGTCLRICYGLERASEDLDFSVSIPLNQTNKLREIFKDCLKDFDKLGISYQEPIEKEYQGNIRFEVRFKGPLYNGNLNSTNTLKVDFNKSRVYNKKAKVIQKLFSDVPLFTLNVLSEEEILSEKVRSLINRKQPRDLYDIWMLIQKNVSVDKELLYKKLKQEKSKLKNIKFPSKNSYEKDLKQLVSVLPDYEQVRKEVEDFVRNLE